MYVVYASIWSIQYGYEIGVWIGVTELVPSPRVKYIPTTKAENEKQEANERVEE